MAKKRQLTIDKRLESSSCRHANSSKTYMTWKVTKKYFSQKFIEHLVGNTDSKKKIDNNFRSPDENFHQTLHEPIITRNNKLLQRNSTQIIIKIKNYKGEEPKGN